MRVSLRRRMTFSTAAIAAAGLVMAAWIVPHLTGQALETQLRRDAQREAELVLSLVEGSRPVRLPPASGDRLVQVRDGDGRIVAASDGAVSVSNDGSEIQVVRPQPGLSAGWVTGDFDPTQLDDGWFVAEAVRRTSGGALLRAYVAAPLARLQPTVQTVRAVIVALIPALLAAVAALTWWNVNRTLRPVERVRRRAATALDAGAPVVFDVGDIDPELAGLVETFNAIIAQLAASLDRQRRLVADASHELLTPLTSIRTNLEVGLRRDDPAWPDIARRCLAIEGRLTDVAQNLLTLASHDLSRRQARTTRFDLAALVEEEAMTHTASIIVRAPGPVTVEGDRSALGQLVHNLVANAVRHAASTVTITVEQGLEVRLIVDDDGEGIPLADRARIFEPFVRLDPDRSRPGGGAGLGLAIAATIAADHGATIFVTDSPGGGARFELRLPRPASAGPVVPHLPSPSGDRDGGRDRG